MLSSSRMVYAIPSKNKYGEPIPGFKSGRGSYSCHPEELKYEVERFLNGLRKIDTQAIGNGAQHIGFYFDLSEQQSLKLFKEWNK